ncbi:MAG TPA: class I SAM-dependent rRNA methyltransferase [Candidatus Binatia bacterium]|jgi:23S rRNA (cytosine1962-C5)-methyltransferase|nr:class I SAM-dependent rRNA methyltransferase [Candidatus Binatia bacterium]
MHRIMLKPGRENPVRAGHPWIFSGAIAEGLQDAEPGEPVRVVAASGQFVAAGYVNPRTSIAVRVVSLEDETVSAPLVARRVVEAAALRAATLPAELTAYRLINGEGDRLPGIVVDRYGDFFVCQILTAGASRMLPWLVDALVTTFSPRGIFERSEGGVRAEEGIAGARGVLAGEEPPVPITIVENGVQYLVDLLHGQKTGFFLDQRDNRARIRALARDRRMLNLFSYTGGFGIAAALGGAKQVVSVDTSRGALELAEAAWALNGLPEKASELIEGDVFDWLRSGREPFDLIVLDPPPFVRRRRDLRPGVRGYRDVNLQAFRRLAPGGWMLTCSCSQHLDRAAFREVVMGAAAAAGRSAQLLGEFDHPADHPTLLAHPEGAYLKALLVRA